MRLVEVFVALLLLTNGVVAGIFENEQPEPEFVSGIRSLGTCADPTASSKINKDCSFYPDCVESKFNCGDTGYPMGYGFKVRR